MAESENLKLQLRSSFQHGWQPIEQTTQEGEHAGKLQQQIANFNDDSPHRVFDRQKLYPAAVLSTKGHRWEEKCESLKDDRNLTICQQ